MILKILFHLNLRIPSETGQATYLAIRPFGKERFVRTKSFGQAYTLENGVPPLIGPKPKLVMI